MKGFVFTLFMISVLLCNAQNNPKDSIQYLLNSTVDNTKKSILYSQLSRLYKENEIDSAIYYAQKGNKLALYSKHSLGIAENATAIGDYYISLNKLDSAKVYYQEAKTHYIKVDSLFKYAENIMRLGNINLAQNNHIEALQFYQECLSISKENNYKTLIPHLYNNIGLIYKDFEDYDDAQSNFQDAYNLFIENKDEENSVYPLYNISLIQSIIGEDEEAINGYLNLIGYHLKTENWVSLASIYNSISEIYLKNEDFVLAKRYLEMALNAIEDREDSFNSGPSSYYKTTIYTNAAQLYLIDKRYMESKDLAYKAMQLSFDNNYQVNIINNAKILGEIYDQENQLDSALHYHKLYIDYNEEYLDEYDIKQLTKLKMQNEFDEILKQKEIERIYQEASYRNRELKFIGITVFSILSLIILILLYVNQKNKNAKLKLKEENLVLEKRKLNQDLEYKKKELTSNMMYLMEKNEFITSISKKLIELKPDAKKDNKDLIQSIINEIRLNSNTKFWEEFEMRFKEVHVKFYEELNKAHPDLTLNETKICAFLRLNMSTKEISAITHQSIKSINMARFRLRKKLEIDRDENLIAYLNSL